jgi:hypothetical protein
VRANRWRKAIIAWQQSVWSIIRRLDIHIRFSKIFLADTLGPPAPAITPVNHRPNPLRRQQQFADFNRI